MEYREYRTVDKSNWNRGPWDDEPDKVQFEDPATKLPCLVVRGPLNALCGYVGVHAGHPLFEKSYKGVNLEAHGGVNFSRFCAEGVPENHHICHVPGPGDPEKTWWFGFDCSHSWDIRPIEKGPDGLRDYSMLGATYKTLSYVKLECARLAAQLHAMKAGAA